ncbi:hypothetical protein ANO11243_096570 [Dothideomycetidae sp. 11243]|nr:hypothetical protein ANO11243_096570 [fungal sp. No.11243]
MSIEINWEALTGGHDGEVLAETIRSFVHDRFQQVALPRMIRSVEVHTFSFGTSKPEVELKDVGDPLPDFYEEEGDVSESKEASSKTNDDLPLDSLAQPHGAAQPQHLIRHSQHQDWASEHSATEPGKPSHEPSPDDLQVMARISYDGDVKLSLTAEILLDYPTPSFVGIPLQLNITGLRFDGIGILAYIKKKAHFCFLAPEDAETLVDGDAGGDGEGKVKAGGLIEEIRVESEIGQKDGGKQVLKNVGKVEKFILEQVRRIFEDEFVYPSFWTFLV